MTRLVSVGAVQPRQRRIVRPRKQELNDVIRNTGRPPTADQGGAKSADCVKYRVEGLGVPGFFGTVRDLFSETGLFEADLSFLHFGREPTGLQSLFGLFDGLLRTTDIDVFGLLGDLRHHSHFGWCDLGVAPQDRHVVPRVLSLVPQLSDAQAGEKMAVSRQDAEFSLATRSDDFIDLLAQEQLLRRHDF